MKPTEIEITRKFNLGNYQTIDYTVKATLDQNEDAKQALANLEKIINDYWEGRTATLVSLAKKEV